MKPFALKTYRIYSEHLDRDVEITVFSSGKEKITRPLIIMHDGQNLFFDKMATYGTSWGLLDILPKEDFPDCVLVGITCGEDRVRMDEYGPFVFDLYAQQKTGYAHPIGGKGDAHLKFVYQELVLHIHSEYKCSEKIFIGGSSLGGVISLYAALTYPVQTVGVFGLSNAFWVSSDSFINLIEGFTGKLPKVYLDLGNKESDDPEEMAYVFAEDQRIKVALQAIKPQKMRHETIENGVHNEASWRLRIEEILRWILNK